MKRKWFSVLVALLLSTTIIVGPNVGLSEEKTVSFTPTMTQAISFDAQQWFSNKTNRALLSTLLGMDLTALPDSPGKTEGFSIDWDSGAYVALPPSSTALIYVLYRLDNGRLIIVSYLTFNGIPASYTTISSEVANTYLFRFYAENMLKKAGYRYYEVTVDELNESAKSIKDLLE